MANNRRKSAAIALAVIGIAGLSLASASQLTVNSNDLHAGADRPSAGATPTVVDVACDVRLRRHRYVADHVYADRHRRRLRGSDRP